MCGLIIWFIIFVCLIAYLVGEILVTIGLVCAGLFLFALIRFIKARKYVASPVICPNCRSRNVRIESRNNGVSGASSSPRYYGHVGVCQDCGFDYPYNTADDIIGYQKWSRGLFVFSAILLVLYIILLVFLFS